MPEAPLDPSPIDYRFGPYSFDGRLRRLFKDGEAVVLTPKAADTLAALLERAGRVVGKDELLRAVWDEVFVGEETLAQNICTLRRVLGDEASRPQFIATVPRRGYKFIAAVQTGSPQTAGSGAAPIQAKRVPWSFMALAGSLGLAVAGGALAAVWLSARAPPHQPIEFTIGEPESGRFSPSGSMLALSPNGEYLSFVLIDAKGTSSLWLRPLASGEARRLDGTEGVNQSFWSPDSRSIAFLAERRLQAVDVASGAVRVVASLSRARALGGTWSRTGQVLFSVPGEGLYVVAATGGVPRRLVSALDQECKDCATWPHFLPDGRHFLYTVASSDAPPPGIYVGELGQPGGRRLLDAVSSCTFIAPDLLVYARFGTLYAIRFDPVRLEVTGEPIPLSDGVAHNARTGRVLAATSETGVLAFRRALVTELVWVDRAGNPIGVATPPDTYLDFSIAPDGQRVAVARVDPGTGTSDIWVFDGGRVARVTDDAAWDGDPVWSEDGRHVVYSSRRDGRWRIYRRLATAIGPEELLLDADTPVTPLQVLASTQLVYSARRASSDIWTLGRESSTSLAHVLSFIGIDARLSSDGQWLAYGRPEVNGGVSRQTVYLSGAPFGEVRRAIADAGSSPRWRADGRELFYLSGDSTVVAVPVDPRQTPSESPGRPLFLASGLAPTGISGQVYDAAPDGRRFLLKREVRASPIHVVLNWQTRLER